MARTVATGLTVADVEYLPYDGRRRDLIDGRLVVTSMPLAPHQEVATRLLVELVRWTEDNGGPALTGPVGMHIAEDSLLGPDLALVVEDHRDRIEDRWFTEPPDLVVEISSPSTRRDDLGRRRELYAEFGVPEYWFVDLDGGEVSVPRLGGGERYPAPRRFTIDDVLTSDLLDGFRVPVGELLVR